jgi:uncharacterized protein DUF4337
VAEVEVHHGHVHAHDHGHEEDRFGKLVGVIVGVIGIVLAAMTIASHRAHTAAVISRTEANDQWAFYQSKKIREHAADNAGIILKLLSNDQARVEAAIEKFNGTRDRYAKETDDIQRDAKEKEHATEQAEHQALRFDLGEGLLELGMVLSSLYFLSKRKLFPYIGISAAVVGAFIGASGFEAINSLFGAMPWHF